MAGNLELARAAYDLLVNIHKDGLTRDQLRRALKTDDRSARDAVNACRVRAATLPHPTTKKTYILGFDPQILCYVAAQDAAQARRIISYQASRVEDINLALSAQRESFEQTFGTKYRATEEVRLF